MENLENNDKPKVTLDFVELWGPRPTSIFNVIIDKERIGQCQVRHTPGKSERMPEGFENHIYIEIDPEFRNQGFATQTLGLALEEAKKIGLREVIVTVDLSNKASIKIIERNNGILLEEKPDKQGNLVRK